MSVHRIEALDDVGRQLHEAATRLPPRRFPRLRQLLRHLMCTTTVR